MFVDTISDSGVMASLRTYDVLAAYLAASAVGDAIPMPFVTQVLDAIAFPPRYRWIFPPIKAAAAVGLFSARWSPGLARLTTAMLTVYFVLAVGFHVRARDLSLAALGAAANAAIFAALTAKESAVSR
jgi:DoxX-like family